MQTAAGHAEPRRFGWWFSLLPVPLDVRVAEEDFEQVGSYHVTLRHALFGVLTDAEVQREWRFSTVLPFESHWLRLCATADSGAGLEREAGFARWLRSVRGGRRGLVRLSGFPIGDGLHGEVVDESAEHAVRFGAEDFAAAEEHLDQRFVFACAGGIGADPPRSRRTPWRRTKGRPHSVMRGQPSAGGVRRRVRLLDFPPSPGCHSSRGSPRLTENRPAVGASCPIIRNSACALMMKQFGRGGRSGRLHWRSASARGGLTNR